MRWSYLIPRLILLLLIWVFFFFAFDPLLKWGFQKSIETAAEARVDIKKLKTKFFYPSLYIQEVYVGDSSDEYKNLLEFSELKFSMEFKPLMEKKFIIKEASLYGLKFGTQRKTSCKLKRKKSKPPEFVSKLTDSAKEVALDRFSDMKGESLEKIDIEISSVKSINLAKELKQKYEQEFENLKKKSDFEKYNTKIESIKQRAEKLKKQKNVLKQIEETKRLKKEVKDFLEEFNKDKKEMESLVNGIKTDVHSIEKAKKEDVENLLSKMKVPSINTQSIAKLLIGPMVHGKLEQGMHWLGVARKYVPENPKSKIRKYDVSRGRVIGYPKTEKFPGFLLKNAGISGELFTNTPSLLDYKGSVEGITTEPLVYGKPAYLKLNGEKGARKFNLKGELDFRGESPKSTFNFNYSGIEIGKTVMGSESSLKVEISQGIGDINGNFQIIGSSLNANLEINIHDAKLNPEVKNIKFEPLKNSIIEALSGLKTVKAEVKISGNIKSPAIDIKTDIADRITEAFKKSIGKEIEKLKLQAQGKIEKVLESYKKDLDDCVSQKKKEALDRININEGKISKFKSEIGKKLESEVKEKIKIPKIKF